MLSFPTVLFGGCLIKSMEAKDLGYTADADLAAWGDAVRRVSKRYGEDVLVVPGHGSFRSAGPLFNHTLSLLEGANKTAN